ncbi:MAG: hypothetical protein KGK00_17180 [Paracoccaceae bacterium]|nr:hypothetical protein [Paracoccaceae bacterium]MDE3238626.1 hypothetical protein [Paracoccaceae bacterium]
MTLIADFLLAFGAFGAAIYCLVLSRRLTRFSTLESGMGGAIAVLSAQVDEMTAVLKKAGATAESSSASVEDLTMRAEAVAKRLELLLASMHDLPDAAEAPEVQDSRKPRFVRRRSSRLHEEAAE